MAGVLQIALALSLVFVLSDITDGNTTKIRDIQEATEWLRENNERAMEEAARYIFAAWDFNTNITEENRQRKVSAYLQVQQFRTGFRLMF